MNEAELLRRLGLTGEAQEHNSNRFRAMNIPRGKQGSMTHTSSYEDGSPGSVGRLGDVLSHTHSGDAPSGFALPSDRKAALKSDAYAKETATGKAGKINLVHGIDSVSGEEIFVSGHLR